MPETNIHILSTRNLPANLLDELIESGLQVDTIPFIDTAPIQTIEVQQAIEQVYLQSTTIVFTSMNAVEAVATWQDGQQPDWSIYCTGSSTQRLAGEYFGEEKIVGIAPSAAALADLIIEDGNTDEVIFFCGNQRREELPALLAREQIDVQEIFVYETLLLPKKITAIYNGILFFSPSAVTAFFEKNKAGEKTVLFAIGATTASEIKKYSSQKVMIAPEPEVEGLLLMVKEYFGLV